MCRRIFLVTPVLAFLALGCGETPPPEKPIETPKAIVPVKTGSKKRAPKPRPAGATKPSMQTAPVD
jgi:hypothetical protein